MKGYDKKFFDQVVSEIKEFVFLKQRKFYEENEKFFPRMVCDENKNGTWRTLQFDKKAGFYLKEPNGIWSYVISMDEIENCLRKSIEKEENYEKLWEIANEIVEKELSLITQMIEKSKVCMQEYRQNIEKNKIYNEYIELKMIEKLRK